MSARALGLSLSAAALAAAAASGAVAAGEATDDPERLVLAAAQPQRIGVNASRAEVRVRASCAAACDAVANGAIVVAGPGRRFSVPLVAVRSTLAAGEAARLRLHARRAPTARVKRALRRRGTRALAAIEVTADDGGEEPARAEAAVALRPGFALLRRGVRPPRILFDGRTPATLAVRFQAPGPTDLRVTVSRAGRRRALRSWVLRDARPLRRRLVRGHGARRDGSAAADGRYVWRVGRRGGRLRRAGTTVLRGHAYPVAGPHGLRGAVGEFAAPRSGGRTHEGFDVTAACGTRLLAAQGGWVRKVADDPPLKGHYVVIRGRGTGHDYLYAHLPRPSPLRAGERVRTGQRIGVVGRSGNAASTPCHLHFEIWPRGHGRGRPIDPGPMLRRWDRWS